jgi:hypothetical protein
VHIPVLGYFPETFLVVECQVLRHEKKNTYLFCPTGEAGPFPVLKGTYY